MRRRSPIGADLCTVAGGEGLRQGGPRRAAVHGDVLLPGLVCDGEKAVPGAGKLHLHGADARWSLTARLIKQQHPGAKVAFIGPCAAKKLEAMRRTVRSEVDFVLTFEEMAGMFEARHIDCEHAQGGPRTRVERRIRGRAVAFAVSGGVAQAVVDVIKEIVPRPRDQGRECARA